MMRNSRETYCGRDYYEMTKVADTLCDIENSVELTDEEQAAMQIAIQAVTDITDIMVGKQRGIVWG